MRRLLLVAFAYPPSTDSGAVRAAGLTKYLPQFGWETVVLTPRLSGGERRQAGVIETDYRDVLSLLKARLGLDPERGLHQQLKLPQSSTPGARPPHTKVIDGFKSLITYPEAKGWIPFATRAVLEFVKREPLDAILTTSPPISAHLIGARLKKTLQIAWVADSRDLWIGPDTEGLRIRERRLEKRTFGAADALVTVSEPWADFLRHRHPGRQVFSITNGFDPDEVCCVPPQLTRCFSITYTGILYQGKRDPTLLFEALRELIGEKVIPESEVRVRFFGCTEPWLAALAQRYGLNNVVEMHGPVPRKQILEKQRESQVLLLLGMNVASDSGCYPAKVFEYLAAQRPILALGGRKGTVTQLMAETQAGVHVFAKPELRCFLADAYRQFHNHGSTVYRGKRATIDQHTHLAMASKFAQIFDSLANGQVGEFAKHSEDVPSIT
jgi:glycosyltransferase involved in cell wall biosynthesis